MFALLRRLFWLPGLLCGAVLAQTPVEPEIRIVPDPEGLRCEADCPDETRCVVWESVERLDGTGWSMVRVDRPTNTTSVLRIPAGEDQRFLRVRALPVPGFSGRVDRIVRAVREGWPEATLLEASSIFPTLVETYPDVIGLRVVFQVEGGSVVVNESDWNEPVSPEFTPMPWLGSAPLPWPVALDELEAEAIYREGGFGTAFGAVTLRQPIYPGMTEPYFIFRNPSGRFIFVGTVTRQVKSE